MIPTKTGIHRHEASTCTWRVELDHFPRHKYYGKVPHKLPGSWRSTWSKAGSSGEGREK